MATYSHLQSVPIHNQDSRPLTIVVEPWAEEFLLSPGREIIVSFEGPPGGEVEVEEKPGIKILYGWPGSVFSVEWPRSEEVGHTTTPDFD